MSTMGKMHTGAASIGEWNGLAVEPTHAYVLESDHAESWCEYVVFAREAFERAGYVVPPAPPRRWDAAWGMAFPDWDRVSVAERDALDAFAMVAMSASGLGAYGGCPGRSFGHAPSVRVYTRFVVVSQACGLDI